MNSPPPGSESSRISCSFLNAGRMVVLFRVVLANTTPRVLSISSGGAGFSTVNGTTEITADRWHRTRSRYDAATGGIGKVCLDGTLEISTTHTGAQANVNADQRGRSSVGHDPALLR